MRYHLELAHTIIEVGSPKQTGGSEKPAGELSLSPKTWEPGAPRGGASSDSFRGCCWAVSGWTICWEWCPMYCVCLERGFLLCKFVVIVNVPVVWKLPRRTPHCSSRGLSSPFLAHCHHLSDIILWLSFLMCVIMYWVIFKASCNSNHSCFH